MPIYPTTEDIIAFHDFLVEIYEDYEPPEKIEENIINPGAIEFIADFASRDTLFNTPFLDDILSKASYYLYHLNRSHPFVDGNKRTSLFTAYYFLRWNGYNLQIPRDAGEFIINIARLDAGVSLGMVYLWIRRHTIRTVFDRFRGLFLSWSINSWLRRFSIFNNIVESLLYSPLPQFVLEALLEQL